MISDTHYKLGKPGNVFIRHVSDAFAAFAEEMENHGAVAAVMGGDLFDVKFSVRTEALDRALKDVRSITSRWPTWMIPGNHDTPIRIGADVNLLNVFASDATVASHIIRVKNWMGSEAEAVFVPFLEDEEFRRCAPEMARSRDAKRSFMFMHQAVRGFEFSDGHEDVWSDLGLADIRDLGHDHVFSGHIHSFQSCEGFTYISSALQSHFDDSGRHGFVFLNLETGESHFVENSRSPRFVTLEFGYQAIEFIDQAEGLYMKLLVEEDVDHHALAEWRQKVESRGNFLRIEFVSNPDKNPQSFAVVQGWGDIVQRDSYELMCEYLTEQYKRSLIKFSPDELMLLLNKPSDDHLENAAEGFR